MTEKISALLSDRGDNYIFPFLWLHGESEETLRKYMQVIYDSNIRAVCVESRPHPDYCGPGWWRDMDIILDEARKRGMKVWILDDSHFPTGFANGAMADEPDELCRQSIVCRTYAPAAGETLHITAEALAHPDPFEKSMIENFTMEKEPRVFDDDRLLGLWAVRLDTNGFENEDSRIDLTAFISNGEVSWQVPEGTWKVYALHISRNFGYHRSYINMMDGKSCRVLIDAVYEPHYAHYKDDFGKTIAGFFSDEPELGSGHMYDFTDPFGSPIDYPWSTELEAALKESLGDDYALCLALLWETGADETLTAKARYAYMDAVSRLVKKDFSMQLGAWCRERGVQYIGHLIEDNDHHSRCGSSLGHYFRGLVGQDMAGIDDIGGQILPQGEDLSYDRGAFARRIGPFYHYGLGKLASSAAAIEPLKKGNSMCEAFGAYGWGEGVHLMKYIADHLLVRGVNHFVPHAFDPKEFPDTDCPPHFYAHGHNPLYRHFGYLMKYLNRCCELISGGRHVAPAALLYHGEGDWTGRFMSDSAPGHVLADSQIDYDIIPQEVFAERDSYHTAIGGKNFCVNTQAYRALVVPYMQFVTKAFAEAVPELAAAGVPVIFIDAYPEGIADTAMGNETRDAALIKALKDASCVKTLEELVPALEGVGARDLSLAPANNRIRYFRYIHSDESEVLLLVNEGTETYKGSVTLAFDQAGALAYEYDAYFNEVRPAALDGRTLTLELEPLHSLILVLDKSAEAAEMEPLYKAALPAGGEALAFAGKWQRSLTDAISYPAFGKAKAVALPDHLAEELPVFSGYVRYENDFIFNGEGGALLEITAASEGVEVFVNGASLGIQIVPTYRFDLTPALKAGANHICIDVATTLERQMAGTPDPFTGKKEPEGLSGITGEVRLSRIG